MDCWRCSAANPDGAKFCNQCGQPLAVAAAPRAAYTPRHLSERVLNQRVALEGGASPS